MSKRSEKAVAYHKKGYNCAQSVACAFMDVVPVDEDTLFRVLEGFGGGMGDLKGSCGALSGAVAVTGLLKSRGKDQCLSKKETYVLSSQVLDQFTQKHHTYVCEELKGGRIHEPLEICNGYIEDAVQILEKVLKEAGLIED
ncbi:MAG TPA: C-GCAxxG-C-C family protein [Candidatus Blautia intestinigallinarum]|nr:C-GCAxxG-C-C family protein [Candidatus Blautia intestinigallinarum]